jgi:hypothetical protein
LEAIYLRKRLENQSDRYKNDLLLDRMYDFLTKLAERKADTKFFKVEKEPEFKIIFMDKMLQEIKDNKGDVEKKETKDSKDLDDRKKEITEMEKEGLVDFINYLVRLNFSSLEGDNYKIRGILEDVPSEIKTLTKEENEFLNRYERLQYLMIVFVNLSDKYSGKNTMSIFTYNNYKENGDLIINKGAEIIPIPTVLVSNKDIVNEIYDGLTQDIPTWYGKEKLEDTAKMINDACDAIFREFINLIRNIVVSRSNQAHLLVSRLLDICPQKTIIAYCL